MRGLSNNVYQRSPERSIPKSSDRHSGADVQYRPSSRISSTRPVHSEIGQYSTPPSDKYSGDVPKYKVINYLAAKRSSTSCDDTNPNSYDSKSKAAVNGVAKNRALNMGKAKIDLENQNSKRKLPDFPCSLYIVSL